MAREAAASVREGLVADPRIAQEFTQP
jgi:hypothetical protein